MDVFCRCDRRRQIRLGLSIAELRTLAFITLVFTSQATVYVARERGRIWHSRPGGWLLLSSLLDLGIAISLAITGVLMRPLPALVVVKVFAAVIVFSFALDAVKFVAFKRLNLIQKAASYEHAVAPPGRGIQSREAQRMGAIGRREVGFGSKTTWRIVMGAIVALAFGGGWLYWSLHLGVATHYVTQKVERGSVVRTVNVSGVVNPATSVLVRPHVSGVIEALYCDYNTHVIKGQLCAKIDPRPYQLGVNQEKADLAAAEARLNNDKADLAQAKTIFERNRALAKRRAISRKVLDKSRKTYEQAHARTKLGEASIAERRAALKAAEINLGYTDIVSPADGTVVSRNAALGQTVAPDSETPLFDIASVLTVMRVDANVGEKDIGEVKLGDKATFAVGSFPTVASPER